MKPSSSLTKKELEIRRLKVLDKFCEGLNEEQISETLSITIDAVKRDLRHPLVTDRLKRVSEEVQKVASARLCLVQNELIEELLEIVRTSGNDKDRIAAARTLFSIVPQQQQEHIITHKLDPETAAFLHEVMQESDIIDIESVK